MSLTKDQYRNFCKLHSLPIFLQYWWLDAVCVDGFWDAAIVMNNEGIQAVMPYYIVKGRLGHKYITMPHMTQFMGPWLIYPEDQKYSSRLSFEKRVLTELIEQLPPFAKFTQNFHHSIGNWLPFYWNQFQQSTAYTYILNDLNNLEHVFKNFKGNIRREIRKAEKQVAVKLENDIESFYNIICKTYSRQGKIYPQSLSFLKGIEKTCKEHNCSRMFFACDKDDQVHSVLYLVWDELSAYYLIGGIDDELRTSGAMSLLMWSAIKYAASVTKKFDFEGSMIQPIERFFSSFGAQQQPYLQLGRSNAGFIKLKQCFKNLF